MRDVGSKRKTKKTAQDRDLKRGDCKLVSITREQLARVAFELEFMEDYFEKHPDQSIPEDERRKMIEIFDQQVQMTHSKIVEEYHEKYPYLHLFKSDPCFELKFVELYKKSKKATSEIIEVNRDVAEASSKNTKRKTTTT